MVHFSGSDILLFVIGFFLPPLHTDDILFPTTAVLAWHYLSIGLTLLGHVPGIAYAWYIVYENRDELETPRHHHNGHTHTYVAVPAQQHPNYQATAAAAAPPVHHPVN
ncbi:hypothetical protein BGZ70_007728 [Mortierella alpina]|uniref:Uncharacterized protein n=1 Tax=Mortierella alpina TaxID=64518 RepID=A0A9P6J5M0_MORAP|nr:hypothetical protein BGZ70_007728 [Mortierella alpina]